jgi:lipopolysaccharide transport system permease protein
MCAIMQRGHPRAVCLTSSGQTLVFDDKTIFNQRMSSYGVELRAAPRCLIPGGWLGVLFPSLVEGMPGMREATPCWGKDENMDVAKRLRELWRYRELIRNLVLRDLKVRYKNSILGVAWTWVNPLLMMVVYTVVFKVMAAGQSDLPNYPVFILCALLPWNFFAASVTQATDSVVEAAPLVKKVYFPREILPVSTVLSNLINFLITLPIFFLLALVMGSPITLWALTLPLAILAQLLFTLGLSLTTSTLNVFYRDTRHILNVLLLAWFFLTPVIYPLTAIPEQYTLLGVTLNLRVWLQRVNPMTSIITSYQNLLYWGAPIGWDFVLHTVLVSLVVLAAGYLVFSHYSSRFGEEV